MRRLLLPLWLGILGALCFAPAQAQKAGYARPELLVETDWAARHGSDPQVRLIDLRSAVAYNEGHLPGAVALAESLLRNSEDKATYLPEPKVLAEALGRIGVTNSTHVVAYDDQGGRNATRLWYVLTVYGHKKVSVVNGGWLKWQAEGRAVQKEAPKVVPTKFSVRRKLVMTCPSEAMLKLKPNVIALDARTDGEYEGKQMSPGAQKMGRVPGAVHVEWKQNLTGAQMVFKSAEELRKLYAGKGVTPDKEIVVYCASGGRASHSLFALTLLGYPKLRLYYGSFSDYTTRPDARIE